MKSKIKIKKDAKKVSKELKKLDERLSNAQKVKVGLPKNSNPYPDGTSVILVGTIHEFGSSNVPQRSFLRSTLQANKSDYKSMIRKLTKQMLKSIDAKKAMRLLGEKVSGDVKKKITDIKTPPLRSREGNPLIDTGHLRQSITYEIEE